MFYLPLSSADDPSQSGSKAANLARAVHLGFQVPDGFVLSRSALREFIEANRYRPTVEAVLQESEGSVWRKRLERFDDLRREVLRLPIPEPIRAEVEPKLIELMRRSPAGLAVRSSSACEDLEKASFAGIYESFLGITDVEAFWQSVLLCWSSMWSPQANAYAKKLDITLPVDGMAVLVQTLIPAESSGVAFTADPVTGSPWRFILNATFGLGSRLVDGSAGADRFVLAWDTAEIIEKRIEKKPTALVFQEGRVSDIVLPYRQQLAASLSDKQAQTVGQLALEVDRAFDRRMDLEWAIHGGRLYLLQARPLTALPPFFPHELSPEEAEETWIPLLNTYGNMTRQEKLIAPLAQDRWNTRLWRQRLEPDDIFPRLLASERDFNGYRYETVRNWAGNPSGYDQQGVEQWLSQNEARLRRGWQDQLGRVHQFTVWLDDWILSEHAAVEWVRTYLEYAKLEMETQAAGWHAPQWLVFTCDPQLRDFLDDMLPDDGIQELAANLLLGLSCYSSERTIAAQDLGRSVHEESVRKAFASLPLKEVIPHLLIKHPGCEFICDFANFCRNFGLEFPRPGTEPLPWALNLDGLLLVIKTSVLGQTAETGLIADARAVLAAGVLKRQATEERVRAYLQDHRPDQLQRFNQLLDWAQFWTPALDNRKWGGALSNRGGELKGRTGQALVAEKLIEQPEHFHLLTKKQWAAFTENTDADGLAAQYWEILHEYEKNRRLVPLPFLGKAPKLAATTHEDAKQVEPVMRAVESELTSRNLFQGEGIVPGIASGIAYKIKNLDDPGAVDRLSGEHILVCGRDGFNEQWRRDWYSLFMVARGLVTVQGAQLHHATQIARECGLPFINLPDSNLDDLPDGLRIEIDGRAGTLIFL